MALPKINPDYLLKRCVMHAHPEYAAGGSEALYKGWFATPLSLETAYPTASDGMYASVGSTDSIWLWDSDTTAWLDSGGASTTLSSLLDTTISGSPANKFLYHDGVDWKDTQYLPAGNMPTNGSWTVNGTIAVNPADATPLAHLFEINTPIVVDKTLYETLYGANNTVLTVQYNAAIDKYMFVPSVNLPIANMPSGGDWNLTSPLNLAANGLGTAVAPNILLGSDGGGISPSIGLYQSVGANTNILGLSIGGQEMLEARYNSAALIPKTITFIADTYFNADANFADVTTFNSSRLDKDLIINRNNVSGAYTAVATADGGASIFIQAAGHPIRNGDTVELAGGVYSGTGTASSVSTNAFKLDIAFVSTDTGTWTRLDSISYQYDAGIDRHIYNDPMIINNSVQVGPAIQLHNISGEDQHITAIAWYDDSLLTFDMYYYAGPGATGFWEIYENQAGFSAFRIDQAQGDGFIHGGFIVNNGLLDADFIVNYQTAGQAINVNGEAAVKTITLGATADAPRLTHQPTGTVDLAIATTKYVNDAVAGIIAGNGLTESPANTFSVLSADFTIGVTASGVSAKGTNSIAVDTSGFTQLDVVFNSAGTWTVAQADDPDTLGVGIVTEVGNPGRIQMVGICDLGSAHGLTVGEYYFLSDTVAGQLTLFPPTAEATFSNPVLYVIDADTIFILPWRPIEALARLKTSIDTASETFNCGESTEMVICDATAASFDVNLLTPDVKYAGYEFIIKKIDASANTVTLKSSTGTIDGIAGTTGVVISTQYDGITVVCDGINYHIK